MKDKIINKLEASVITAMKNHDFNTAVRLDTRIKEIKKSSNKK